MTWIQESFADGIPGDASKVRSLASVAGRAGADGDRDLALKLLYGAALQCWWSDPGQEARDQVVAAAERLDVDQGDPRLLVVLAFAAPIERGAAVIERLARLEPGMGGEAGAARLAGNAAMAVGAFDIATRLLAAAAAGLRAQGRLGLLARTLALQAWTAASLADRSTAIPAAEEGSRLAQETSQPLVLATAQAAQALLAAVRGDQAAAAELAAQAEQVSVPIGASGVLAAVQFARGLAALSGGRPAEALEHLRACTTLPIRLITSRSGAARSVISRTPPAAAATQAPHASSSSRWRQRPSRPRRRCCMPACGMPGRCSPGTLTPGSYSKRRCSPT